MLQVITIGTATKDVFLTSKGFKLLKSDEFSTGVGECFAFGAKIDIADICFDSGGGATNAAATFANLGIDVGVHSHVGNDTAGAEIIVDLKMRGADVSRINKQEKLKTAYSTILVSKTGERTILVYRGASARFDASKIEARKFKSKWFYLASVAGDERTLSKVFSVAQKNKVKVFWNPGGGELKLGLKKILPLLKQVSVLSMNKEEAASLTGKSEIRENLKRLGLFIPMVWITDGSNGAYFRFQNESYHLPSITKKVINSTGAGDAFGSGFIAGLILKNDWQYAAKLAVLNADGTIREMGAKNGLLTRLPGKNNLKRVKILQI